MTAIRWADLPKLGDFLTDGVRLWEVAAARAVQNYGLAKGTIRYVVIRDCVTEAEACVDDLHLACLTPVGQDSDMANIRH